MGGGAWPFLVGGVICLVNSVNERDLNLLNSYDNIAIKAGSGGELSGAFTGFIQSFAWFCWFYYWLNFLEGLFVSNEWKFEAITGL